MRFILATAGILSASLSPAFAITAAPGAQGGFGGYQSLVLLVVFVVAMYFLMIRPQSKRNKEHKNLLANISKGDEVVTAGGVFGVVEKVAETTVELKVAENTVMKFQKQSIANVLPKGTVKSA